MNLEDMKRRSRGFGTDMSGEAVAKRIDMVSQLRELGLAMKKARILGPVPAETPGGEARRAPEECGTVDPPVDDQVSH